MYQQVEGLKEMKHRHKNKEGIPPEVEGNLHSFWRNLVFCFENTCVKETNRLILAPMLRLQKHHWNDSRYAWNVERTGYNEWK